jgi:acetyltransferase-like isoleucine patch superfamily enzyme
MIMGKYVCNGENITIGKNVKIDNYVHLSGNNIIGDNVTIRLRSTIGEHAKIGDNTYISPSVDILSYDIYSGKKHGVTIGKNCIIGAKAVIAPGVTIGDNVIIGACSFVNKDCLEEGKYFGIPAKKIIK